MLSVEEAAAYVKKHLSYKPGWTFQIYQGRHEGVHISITTYVQDAFAPDIMCTLDVHSVLPRVALIDTDHLEDWIAERLARIEVHEQREWFKRDGRVIDSPHAEFADRDL